MLVTARPSLPVGVVAAAAAPITVLFASWLLVAWTGGPEELSRITGAAGPFAALVALSGLVELAFLTVMVCHTGSGRVVPLAVMLGMCTLPWTVGLLGAEAVVGHTVAELAGLDAPEARNALALGVSEAMASRMLGAWMSSALLVGMGLGLSMAGASADVPWRSTPRGSTASLLFGVVVAFVLGAIALAGALEAHQLFQALSRLLHAPLSEQVGLLSASAENMSYLRPIRLSCLAVLATLGGVLLVWQARRASRPAQGWMGSAFLMAAVAALLMLDRHPLRSAEECARATGLGAPSMPSNFQPLTTLRASTPRPLAALATEEGLVPATGARLSWSTPTQALAASLSSSLHSTSTESSPSGATPEPVLPLLADARLPGGTLRQIIRASTLAGARSVVLLGQQPHAASPGTLEWFEARRPLFSLLAARVGMLQLLLPSALPHPQSLAWHGRLEAGRTLQLSSAQGSNTLTLPLQATPAEIPEVLAGTFVGLELSDDISLKELGAAAEVLGLAGASPVALVDSEPRVPMPAKEGTSTLWSSPRLWSAPVMELPFPEFLQDANGPRRTCTAQAPAAKPHRALAPRRRAPLPRVAAQDFQMRTKMTMAATIPTPKTPSITSPSYLDDRGTFGAASESGFVSRAVGSGAEGVGAGGSCAFGGSAEYVTTDASRSSRPSRANARTLLMWSM